MIDRMRAEFLRALLDAVLYESDEIDALSLYLEVGIVDSRSAEQACRELVEMAGMLVDESDQLLLCARQGIHLYQARAGASDRGQRRLEGMCETIQNRGPKLLALPRCLSTAFRGEGARPLNRDSGKRSRCIDGSGIERMAADYQRTDGPRPRAQNTSRGGCPEVIFVALRKVDGTHFILGDVTVPLLHRCRL